PGLSLNASTGVVSGTPSSITGSPFTVQFSVLDTSGTTAKGPNLSLAVSALPLVVTAAQLPTGILNAPYPQTPVNASGGIGAYTFSATGLPPGLTMDSNGFISGTPTTTTGSPFSVVVTVTDASGASANRTFPLTISG